MARPRLQQLGTEILFKQPEPPLRDMNRVRNRVRAEKRWSAILKKTRGCCKLSVERLSASMPVVMDEALQAALDRAAENRAPGKHIRMSSGAGHDTQCLARKLPAAKLCLLDRWQQ